MTPTGDEMPIASSECPLCGVDKPHVHTKRELVHRFQEESLRKEFEMHLYSWFVRYKDLLPGSYGMSAYLTRKLVGLNEYWWWPVQMLWQVFQNGAYFTCQFPSEERDEVPELHEALRIKNDPFGKQR